MASNSPSASAKLTFLVVVCVAILAPLATAHSAAAPEGPPPIGAQKFSFFRCISFVSDATKCLRDVFKQAVAPHPSCCEAIAKLNDCSSSFLKAIPSDELSLIKDVCALWGVTIP